MKAKEYAEIMEKLKGECIFKNGEGCIARVDDQGHLYILSATIDGEAAIQLAKWILETFE